MAIRTLRKLPVAPDEPTDITINRLQTHLVSVVNPVISNPIFNGNYLQAVQLVAKTPQLISHGLGRNYIGWFLSRPNADGYVVYETTSPDNATFVKLNCDTTITISVYIF